MKSEIINAQPSRDPANDSTMTGMMRQIMKKNLQGIDDMLPAKVIAYDRDTNRATVQPMIKIVATNGQSLTRAQIASVPVYQYGGGGMMISFNLKAGDLGWIKASDRDISLYLQDKGSKEQNPNTARLHSFEDALFFPDVLANFAIEEEDKRNGNLVIQNLDATVRIAVWLDRVKITAPFVEIDSPTTYFTGDTWTAGTGHHGTPTIPPDPVPP